MVRFRKISPEYVSCYIYCGRFYVKNDPLKCKIIQEEKMEQVKRLQTTTRPVNKNKSNIKHMAMIGMMGALSTILMLFDFPVPLAPTFAKMDFSELPIILYGFMYGPLAGITTAVVKIILNFVLNGTDTMGVGELANLIGSVSYLLPSVLIYRKQKGKKGAVTGLIIGTLFTSVSAIFGNMCLVFPAYAKLYGMSVDAIISMGKAVNPMVHDMFSFMLFSMFPFNLIKFGTVSIIVFFVYKKLSAVIHRYAD